MVGLFCFEIFIYMTYLKLKSKVETPYFPIFKTWQKHK